MKTLKIFGIALAGFFSVIACSEDSVDDLAKGTLTGIVVESGSNTPLENVKISTNPNSSTVFTDVTGNFIIEEILEGQYSVQAELEGFLVAFEAAEITRETTTNVVFELEVETANNRPPSTPILLTPEDGAIDIPLETELAWSSSDPEGDDISYTIELRNDVDNEVLSFETLNDTTVTVSNLRFGLKYFWQVTAKDDVNMEEVLSQVSVFETVVVPENRFLFVRKVGENNVIFSSDEDGNELQLTSDQDNSFRPRRDVFSQRIAFLSNNGAETHIFSMNLDGSEKQQITTSVPVNGFDLNEIDFSWADSGGRLVYPNFDKLYSINSDGTGLTEVYQTSDGSFITEVVVNSKNDLYVLKTNDVSGYNVSIFTLDLAGNVLDDILSDVAGAAGGIDISVDDSKVLYWYDVSGFENTQYRQLNSRIFIYDRDNQITTDQSVNKPAGTLDFDCRFSPNEAQIIFTNTSNDGVSQKNIGLITVLLDDDPVDDRQDLFENAEMPDYE